MSAIVLRVATAEDEKAERARQLKAKATRSDEQLKTVGAALMVTGLAEGVVLGGLGIVALVRHLRR